MLCLKDKHGIPCRDHHEDEMRMAHEVSQIDK